MCHALATSSCAHLGFALEIRQEPVRSPRWPQVHRSSSWAMMRVERRHIVCNMRRVAHSRHGGSAALPIVRILPHWLRWTSLHAVKHALPPAVRTPHAVYCERDGIFILIVLVVKKKTRKIHRVLLDAVSSRCTTERRTTQALRKGRGLGVGG